MNEEEDKKQESKDLDELLSMRGKPFADWKEERKYLREKWGMQGRQIVVEPNNLKQTNQEDGNS
tara:strand:+ start:42 stop:233 length:192 start_codon:yes stop_codon:yes gene_type:complete